MIKKTKQQDNGLHKNRKRDLLLIDIFSKRYLLITIIVENSSPHVTIVTCIIQAVCKEREKVISIKRERAKFAQQMDLSDYES